MFWISQIIGKACLGQHKIFLCNLIDLDMYRFLGMTRLMGLHLFNVVLEFILHDYFLSAQLGRRVQKRETVIPDPDYRIPVVLLGL